MANSDLDKRVLSTVTINAEWKRLLKDLRPLARIIRATEQVEAGGVAVIWLRCSPNDVYEVDRTVMACQVLEPKYRQEQGNCHVLILHVRSWWRRSVPYLMDPDGRTHHYRALMEDAPGPSDSHL